MAWTTPLTWADTTVYTAAQLDQQLKDNLGFLYSPPSCLSYSNANQSVAHNTNSGLNMQAEAWDTDGIHSTSSTTYRHSINTAGTYLQFCAAVFAITATSGYRSVYLQNNGTTRTGELLMAAIATVTTTGLQAAHTGLFTATDYIDTFGYQNSGGALNVLANTVFMLTHWCGNP